MKVKDIIKTLESCNPEHRIYVFLDSDHLYSIDNVDLTLIDRVDINLNKKKL